MYSFSFTGKGAAIQLMVKRAAEKAGYSVRFYAAYPLPSLEPLNGDLSVLTERAFSGADALVFIGAAAIAVRSIAPYINSKLTDPAVLSIDDGGGFVVPLLSGHIGGANALASLLAAEIEASAVITTATDIAGAFAVDVWATKNGCSIIEKNRIKAVSSAILKGARVGFVSDFPISGLLPESLTYANDCTVGICVTEDILKNPFDTTLHIAPKRYVLGIGCRKGAALESVKEAARTAAKEAGIGLNMIKTIATIDLKIKEEALLALSEVYDIPIKTYSAEQLMAVPGEFDSSGFVMAATGADNVCERAAFLASAGGVPVLGKRIHHGVTVSLAAEKWHCSFEDHQAEKI